MIDSTCVNRIFGSIQKWKIGNDVRSILLADTGITQAVGTKIFPLIAPEGTDGNFIVYGREKYSKLWVKEGVYEDDCLLAITVVSDNYDSAIDIAEKVDNALTGYHTIDTNKKIRIDLEDSTESYQDLKYMEVLMFAIK